MLKQSRNALTNLTSRYRAVLRRCRLRALALALGCALIALPPLPAHAENRGGSMETIAGDPAYVGSMDGSGGEVSIDSDFNGDVYGGYTDGQNATGNTVTMTGGTLGKGIVGGKTLNGDALRNTVIISGGQMQDYSTVSGGTTAKGNAMYNRVAISGGSLGYIYGGQSSADGKASDNTVIMTGGSAVGVYGGGAGESVTISNNTVIISGGTVTWNVAGGRTDYKGVTIKDNTVILMGAPDLSSSTIYGGLNFNNSGVVSGNRLEVRTSGLTARNIQNFEYYAFQLPATVKPGDTGLTLTDGKTTIMAPGGAATFAVTMQGIAGNGPAVKVGDRFTFLSNAAGLDTTNLTLTVQQLPYVRQGVSLTADFDVKQDATSIYAEVTGMSVNPQTKALAEGHLGGTALTLQGADLAAGKGMEAAGQAVRAARAEGRMGVAAFGALSGGWSRYNTGSHIDVSGVSLLTGLAWGADSVLGQFTAGMFFEFGSAAIGTYNSFSNAASVSGDGSAWYMGAGLLARMDFNDCGPGHVYTEASARAGGLHNDYRNDDLRDVNGRRADFDTTTPYVSLHAGLGYIWDLTDALSLDLHAKYFWTWQDGADTDLSTGEALHFDAVNSHRLRLGGRLTWAANEYVSPYIGAAWEHEFDGKARAASLGYDLDAPSLTGDTGIGELGLSWTPSPTTPLTIDLSVQGYTGVREGYTGSFMAKWEF